MATLGPIVCAYIWTDNTEEGELAATSVSKARTIMEFSTPVNNGKSLNVADDRGSNSAATYNLHFQDDIWQHCCDENQGEY